MFIDHPLVLMVKLNHNISSTTWLSGIRKLIKLLLFFLITAAGHVAVKPLFTEEPGDKFVLPNTPASLICEAKFVKKLKFNCSGKLVPREILNDEFFNNATFLLAEISESQIKNRTSVFLCNCVATGYNGQVIGSRTATVQRACKCAYVQCLLLLMHWATQGSPKN